MDAGDIATVIGTLCAALIGVGGLAIVLVVERHERSSARLGEALARVIESLGERAMDLDAWLATERVVARDMRGAPRSLALPPRDAVGGPLDARLQVSIDAAWMLARKNSDRVAMKALGDATYNMKFALISWQIPHLGQVAGLIRKWRTGEMDCERLCIELENISKQALASGEANTGGRAN